MARRVIALLRVSTEEQAGPDRFGLAAQRAAVARIAERHDLEVVETVELAGVSGAAVLQEPRYARMLARLAEPEIAGVVVAEFSRLMRPEEPDDYRILGAFRRAGKLLWTPEGARDMREFGGRLLSVLEAELAANERALIAARTRGGKVRARAAGRHPGGAHTLPRAVHYDRASGTWAYRWPEAERVREAYRAVLAGERNLAALGRRLGMDRHTLREALRHPIYRGTMRWQDGQEVRVIAEPLVSWAEWDLVQAVLDDRPRPVRRDGPPWLYAGLLRCAVCGATVYATDAARWGPQYRCQSSALVGVGCATGQLVQRAVDAAADEALGQRLGRREVLVPLVAAALAARRRERPAGPDAEAVARSLSALRAERERVVRSFERGMRTEAAALARCSEIDAECEALARLAADRPVEHILEPQAVALAIVRVLRGWERRTWAERQRLARAAVRALHVERAGRGRARIARVDLHLSLAGGHHERRPGTTGADFLAIPLH